MIVTVTLLTIVSFAIGVKVFGRWYNPATLFSVMWGGTLALFLSGLIRYYPLDPETWFVIVAGWCSFMVGILLLGPRLIDARIRSAARRLPERNIKRLVGVLWVLNLLSLATALQHWWVVSSKYGGIGRALVLGNFLYSSRVAEGIPGTIPYLGALALVACVFGGVLTGILLRPTLVAVMPLITTIMIEMAQMGRAKLIMAAVLFATGFFLAQARSSVSQRVPSVRWRKLVIIATGLAILVAGAETVRSLRGASETFTGSTRALQQVGGLGVLTPSIIMYFSVHYGVLNQYWKEERENTPFGFNTLAPAYRVVAKLAPGVPVPTYPPFYRTPIGANTGTYLREFHADFGVLGIVVGPLLLGLLAAFAWWRHVISSSLTSLSMLAFLMTMIVMSVFYTLTRSGDMIIFLIVSAAIGRWLDSASTHSTAP